MGLRELKKVQTRQLIADTAWRLFADRGFEPVTVTEIAARAQVAPATVFNYFPTKEDLFFQGLDVFGERLVSAVATRQAGESALAAVRRLLLGSGGLVARSWAADPVAAGRLRTLNRVIDGSPALQAREQQSIARYTDSLADLLAAESDAPAGDVEARVAANALVGVHRTLLGHVRRRVLQDEDLTDLADDLQQLATAAFDLLEDGLRNFAIAAPSDTPAAGAQSG